MQGMEKTHGESGRGAHATAGGEIAVMVDFQAAVPLHFLQNGADGGMLDIADLAAGLVLRINDTVTVLEERRQITRGQVTIFVDAGGKYDPALVEVPAGIIGSAPKERDAKR